MKFTEQDLQEVFNEAAVALAENQVAKFVARQGRPPTAEEQAGFDDAMDLAECVGGGILMLLDYQWSLFSRRGVQDVMSDYPLPADAIKAINESVADVASSGVVLEEGRGIEEVRLVAKVMIDHIYAL